MATPNSEINPSKPTNATKSPGTDVQAAKYCSTSDSLIVASIDFGTTFSGWAYSLHHDFENNPTNGFVKQWHSGSGTLSTDKTPTVVLVQPDGKTLEAFGYEAENMYKELTDVEEHGNYYYFRKFKMKLYKKLKENIDRNFMLEDEMGKTLPALDVFTMAIKYFVDDLHGYIKKTIITVVKPSDIRWVLTVPAIWTDQAKQFMRTAAENAGIERHKLSIALEPEAASAFCRHLPLEGSELSLSSLTVGTKYMVLDAGGGTIDITVHEVMEKSRVKEVIAASGGGWGGSLVDEAFERLVEGLVGCEVYQAFKKEQTEDWLYMMREFEVKKRTVRPDKEGRFMVKFPLSLSKMSEQKNGRNLTEHIRNSANYAKEIEFISDKIKFQNRVFQQLFKISNDKVVQHIKDIMEKNMLSDLNIIIMVGGYSDSPMLQQAVTTAFPSMKVIIPNEASIAVVRGALICGHRCEFIAERVLKYTYGVRCASKFIEGKHPENRRFQTDKGDRCSGIFDKHVEKGEIVRAGEAQCKLSYYPLYINQERLTLEIYASELHNPEYADQDCKKLGSISVSIIPGDLEQEVVVYFTFSGTEIEVDVSVVKTGEKNKLFIDLPH